MADWLGPALCHSWAVSPAPLQIEIAAKRNEIIDQSSLIARYQQEIALLRGQLEIVMRERESPPAYAPMLALPALRPVRKRRLYSLSSGNCRGRDSSFSH